MTDFFASLYEWWGLNPLYGTDLGDHLRGFDPGCSGNFTGTQYYLWIGISFLVVTLFAYLLFYHIVDSKNYKERKHWLIALAILLLINFLIAFVPIFNDFAAENYCVDKLTFSNAECFGFGFTNAIWTFIFFTLLSANPFRKLSKNCKHTPWKK